MSLNLTIALHILISSQTDKKPPLEKEAKHMTLDRHTQSGRYFDRHYRSGNDVIIDLLQLAHSFGIVSIVLKEFQTLSKCFWLHNFEYFGDLCNGTTYLSSTETLKSGG